MEIDNLTKKLNNENKNLISELKNLRKYKKNLELIIENIISAKAFKLWKKYCNFRDNIVRPDLLISSIKQRIPWELKYNLKKFLSHFDWNKKKFESYKKILLNTDNQNEEIKQITKKVSVIIPTKNAGPLFELVLKKITFQKYIQQLEIIILDSGSTDDTLKIAKRFNAKIIKIKPEDFSHSTTRNVGAKYAMGDYIVFTVQDAFFLNEKTLYDLISLLDKTGAVAGSARQIPRFDADLFTSWQIDYFTKYISPNKQNILIDIDKNKFAKLTFEKKRSYCTIDDVCSIFLKTKFTELGGYDEKLKYGEDLEIGKKIIETGNKIIYLCDNGVVHSHTRPASYFLKRFYIDTVFRNTVFKNSKITNTNSNFDVYTLLHIFLKLGKTLERKYSIKVTSKKSIFTSLELISSILKTIGKKSDKHNDNHNTDILQKELDTFIKYQLDLIGTFTNIENLSSSELITLIDKIFSLFVGDKLANYYLINNRNYPELNEINNILEKGV